MYKLVNKQHIFPATTLNIHLWECSEPSDSLNKKLHSSSLFLIRLPHACTVVFGVEEQPISRLSSFLKSNSP